jgi:hypothetical protein
MAEPWEDEIDAALRTLRADVPAMTPHAFAAGRARLHTMIGETPVAGTGAAAPEPVVVALPPSTRRRSPPTPWLVAAAAAAVVALGTVGTVALRPNDSTTTTFGAASTPTTPAPEAETYLPDGPLPAMPARPLNRAANLAAKASDVTLKPGEVLYVKNVTTDPPSDLGPGGALTYEFWVPRDRNAQWLLKRISTRDVKGGPEGGRDEQRVNGGTFEGNTYEVPDDSAWSPSPDNVAALSRDPAVLYEKLRAEVNATPPADAPKRTSLTPAARAADIVFTLLADPSTTVPADLRAAVLRTLGFLPGITVREDIRFADGRPAVILSWQLRGGQSRTELVLDAATARPIMYRDVATTPVHGIRPGQPIWTATRTEAIVHALGLRP